MAEDINQWLDDFSTLMSDHAINLAQAQAYKKGGLETYQALVCAMVAKMVGTCAVHSLLDRPTEIKSKKDMREYTEGVFNGYKAGMSEAVASGFAAAMTNYVNKPVEYYCTIKIVPEPINKQAC